MSPTEPYDTIVVGSGTSGAATAMLLARAGQRVLMCGSARPGAEPPAAHPLLHGGVLRLHRWGLLDAVAAAGTPAIRRSECQYGGCELDIADIRPGMPALYGPRRAVLESVLAKAAIGAGAEVRSGTRVLEVLRDRTGRAVGIHGVEPAGRRFRATADLTVGADGTGSAVAAAVHARALQLGRAASGLVDGYWSGVAVDDRYRQFFAPGAAAGAMPTNGGQLRVWLGLPSRRFGPLGRDRTAGYRALLMKVAPRLAGELAGARLVGPVRGFPGIPGYVRTATGPGWALVGEAGWFIDPITAHGVTAGLRDAELLARAVVDGDLAGYQMARDDLSIPLLGISDRIASYRWDLSEIRGLLVAMNRATAAEIETLNALDRPVTQVA